MSKSTYFTTLTPLRGLAALAIVLHHCHRILLPLTTQSTGVIEMAYLAVDFFFILSGFVLAHRYGAEFDFFEEPYFRLGVNFKSYCQYLKARALRILPLYYLSFLLTFGTVSFFIIPYAADLAPYWKQVFSVKGLISSIFLIQGFPLNQYSVWNIPSWSLSVEWWMYLLFPVLWKWFVSTLDRPILVKNSLILIFIGYLGLYYGFAPYSEAHKATLDLATDFGFFRCFLGFMAGLLTYRLYQFEAGARLFSRNWLSLQLIMLLLLGMHFEVPAIFLVVLFPPLILSAVSGTDAFLAGLTLRPFQWLGDISYSIYLLHFLLIYGFIALLLPGNPHLLAEAVRNFTTSPDLWEGWCLAIPILLLSLPLAYFSYIFIELPFRKNGKRTTQIKGEIVVS